MFFTLQSFVLPSVIPVRNPKENQARKSANVKKNLLICADNGERECDECEPRKPTRLESRKREIEDAPVNPPIRIPKGGKHGEECQILPEHRHALGHLDAQRPLTDLNIGNHDEQGDQANCVESPVRLAAKFVNHLLLLALHPCLWSRHSMSSGN